LELRECSWIGPSVPSGRSVLASSSVGIRPVKLLETAARLKFKISRFLDQYGGALNGFTAVICYCDKTSSFALARNRNPRFLKLSFILVPTNCTKALGFVMWITHSETYSRMGQVA
jgi:hypothetical protein